jgi:ABC-type transporter Mla MlaB component
MIQFSVRGPIARADLPGLCERICGLLSRAHGEVAWCDVAEVPPDAITVEALARLQVAARRRACSIRLRNASPELRELVAFMGLSDVVA